MAQETSAEALSGVEKASLLLVALGTDGASSVLQRLSPEQVKSLGAQISKLRNVEPAVRDNVLREFASRHTTGLTVPAAEYAREILEQALGPAKAQDIVAEILTDSSGQPFDWLKSVGTPRLAACLRNERPQVIALVCAYLSPMRAADVISQLPEQVQGDVAYRLGYMQSVSPEIAEAVEDSLETKLSREGNTNLKAVGGVNSLVAILNNADRATETKIFDYLETIEAGVAESVREMLFVFDDIAKMDDQALQAIIQETEQEDLRLAIKGTTEPIRQAFFKNMSERAAEAMKEDLEMMGRVKVRDVEAAQRRVTAVVRRLDEAGTISIRSDSEEFVS
jgi:flagellar motor switch protein FliG